MRFWLGKIQCPPLICCCKPSPHIYTTGPIPPTLENTPHVPSGVESIPETSASTVELKQEIRVDKEQETQHAIKSCLRKPSLRPDASKEKHHKKVQWTDFLGKELVEIREFEPSEVEDTDDEDKDKRSCLCSIL